MLKQKHLSETDVLTWEMPSLFPLKKVLMAAFSHFFIKWQMATDWTCEVNNSLSSNNNSKQIHTNPLLTFHKFLFPCVWNSGCHTHTHTVRHPDPLLGPPQYVTIPLFCRLKEVISSNSARAPFITTTVPSLLVPVSTFPFLLIPLRALVSAAVFLIKWGIHREMGISFTALHSSPSCLHSWITG